MRKILYTLVTLFVAQAGHASILYYDINPNGTATYSSGTGVPYSFTVLTYQFNLKYDTAGFSFYTTNPSDQLIGVITGSGNELEGYTGSMDFISPTSSDWTNEGIIDPQWDWNTMLAFRIPAGAGNYKYAWLWVNLQVNNKVTIYSYGYENVNNTHILAGLMSGGASTGIEDEVLGSISMYPNPASGYVCIENKNLEYINHVEIFDISGKMVESAVAATNKMNIDVNTFTPGVYFVRIHMQDGSILAKRLVVE